MYSVQFFHLVRAVVPYLADSCARLRHPWRDFDKRQVIRFLHKTLDRFRCDAGSLCYTHDKIRVCRIGLTVTSVELPAAVVCIEHIQVVETYRIYSASGTSTAGTRPYSAPDPPSKLSGKWSSSSVSARLACRSYHIVDICYRTHHCRYDQRFCMPHGWAYLLSCTCVRRVGNLECVMCMHFAPLP